MRFSRFLELSAHTAPAVVLGVFNATGIGVVHDLAIEGVPILALDTDPWAPGLRSRLAATAIMADPHHHEDDFIAALVDIGRRLPQKAVLFPCQDDCIFVASRRADELAQHFWLPFSGWDSMQLLANKEEQVKAARRAGVGVPRTAFLHSQADLTEAVLEVPFPAVLKSAEHLAMRRRNLGKAILVPSADALPEAYCRAADSGHLLLQEVIPGADDQIHTLFSYLDSDSRPLAQFTRHKLRQHPRRFGVCRFGESLWVESVATAGLAMLQEVKFHGVSGVEFKRDPRDGELKLMEVNARHPAGHRLAAALGVNITYIAYNDVLGRRIHAPRQVDGPRWIVSSQDIPDSITEIIRGEMSAGEWLRSLKGTRVDGMFSLVDPVPGAYEFARHGWTGTRNALRRRLGARRTRRQASS